MQIAVFFVAAPASTSAQKSAVKSVAGEACNTGCDGLKGGQISCKEIIYIVVCELRKLLTVAGQHQRPSLLRAARLCLHCDMGALGKRVLCAV